MASEPNLLAIRPLALVPSEADYQSFCATFSESARGRWFLGEYAKRNRNADTEVLLAALDRIEALVRIPQSESGLRGELRVLRDTMRLALPDIEETANPSLRMAKLKAMLDLLERRIGSMIGEPQADEIAAATLPPAIAPRASPPLEAAADLRARLSVVPPPDEPELPIPTVTNEQPRAIALVTSVPVTVLAPAPAAQVIVIEPAMTKPPASIAEAADLTQIAETTLHFAGDPDACGFVLPQATNETESDPPPPGWLSGLAHVTPDQTFVAFEIEQHEVEPAASPAVTAQTAEPADDILGPPERITVEILKSPQHPPTQPVLVMPPTAAPQGSSSLARPQRAAADPLAPLRGLSEEEVLALFS